MKMQEAHFEYLKREVNAKLADMGHTVDSWTQRYIDNGWGKNKRKRARWDALWLLSNLREQWFPAVYSDGLNDDHIDTALRKIFGHPPNQ